MDAIVPVPKGGPMAIDEAKLNAFMGNFVYEHLRQNLNPAGRVYEAKP